MRLPGRQQPAAAVVRQAQDRPQDGPASGLSPKGESRSAQHEGIPASRAAFTRGVGFAALLALLLSGCVSVGIGNDPPLHAHLLLRDTAPAPPRRAEPLVDALLIQPLPADALADTLAIAYSRQAHEFAFYQFASWTERPVRHVPRLLQRRLEAAGIAGAVGVVGDPLRADWLVLIGLDTLHHDVALPPGKGRVALNVELFDRRNRTRIARQQFVAAVPAASADAPAAAAAMSAALTQAFDDVVPWLEVELARAKAPR
jgi:ABC-type uncharacterized transport system auxiliary subunit